MTDDRLPLAELMAKTGDGDFLRSVAESVLQSSMEADGVTAGLADLRPNSIATSSLRKRQSAGQRFLP